MSFSLCFNRDIPLLSPADTDQHNVHYDSCSEDLLCTPDKVLFLIETLYSSKANGPNGVSAQMLKARAHSIAPSLTKIFNISIIQGCFPECWKTSTVVPIPKSGNHKGGYNHWTGLLDWTTVLDYWTHPNCKIHLVQCRTEAKRTYSLSYFANTTPYSRVSRGQRSRAHLISFIFGGYA